MPRTVVWLGLSLALAMAFLLCTVMALTAGEVAAAAAAPADILTVCKAGPPACDFSVVQTAVDAAAPNDVIKVAAGVYSDVNSYAGLAQAIYISRAITIQGGYTPAFDEPPDPENNPTIIDAQGLGRSVAIITSPDVDVVLAGLQITGGDATGLGGLAADDIGGGILSLYANLTLSHSIVFSNTDNRNVSFTSRGGGIFIGAGNSQILDTVITHNSGDYGGGLSTYSTHLLLSNSQIINNEGKIGGGIFLQDTEGDITGNLIQSNLAAVGNNTGVGGGIVIYYSNPALTNNLILANVTDGLGGGVLTVNADLVMVNSIIADNQAALNGDGLYLSGSTGQLIHSTIANNGQEGLVVTDSLSLSGLESHLVLSNTIVAGHDGMGVVAVPDSTAGLYNTLWYDNFWDYAGNLTTTANFTGDPAFIDPANGDFHITATSAALNLGAVTGVLLDIDGESRLVGPAPDLGADEWPLPPTDIPIEGLTAVNDSPTPLKDVTLFTATINSGSSVNYTWSFGDGTTGGGANASHVYANPDVYTAVVTASNSVSIVTATTTVTVTVTDVVIEGLTAVNSSPTELGTAAFLTATITAGSNVSYAWDFGDGTAGAGATVSHVYASLGVYTAVVTSSNSVSSMTATTVVTITDAVIEGLMVVNDSPTPLGNHTTLAATISSGSNVSYTWDFGDSSQETGATVSHVYANLGVYTAVVTATNSINTLTATTTVTVTDVAIAGLTAVNSSPTELGTATFLTGTIAAGTNVSYTWDLGDGTVGHGRLLSHTYSLTGTFTAVVTASNSLNTITDTTPVVIAASLPAPSFILYLPLLTKPAAIEICCSVKR